MVISIVGLGIVFKKLFHFFIASNLKFQVQSNKINRGASTAVSVFYMSQAFAEIRHFRKCLGNSGNAWNSLNCLGISGNA